MGLMWHVVGWVVEKHVVTEHRVWSGLEEGVWVVVGLERVRMLVV